MTKSDILDVNDKYFKDCNNKITELNLNTIYIFAILSETYNKPVEKLLQAKNLNKTIKVSDDKINYLYLSNEVESYLLDFSDNKIMRYIQLSRLTIDSEVIIKDLENGEEVKLSKDRIYYTFNEMETPFKGKISVRVNKGKNALIEFIFMYPNNNNIIDILDSREYLSYNLTRRLALIKFDKNDKNRNVYLSIFSKKDKEFRFSMVSGYTKKNYFHYSADNIPTVLKKKYVSTDIRIFNSDIPLDYEEYFYIMLIFEDSVISDDSLQISLTKIEKYSIDDFNVDISEEKCKLVVDSVTKLMDQGYIYTDIIRNPPNPEYFGKVELISDLKKVQTSNRKYYDFFRDIRRIIGKMKDGHLNIVATKSPNGYELKNMTMCLPFSFIIKGDTPEAAKIYIEKYNDCFNYYSRDVQKFVEDHLEIPLIKVNNTDPFDFIQNIQIEFNAIHNLHAHFSRSINTAHKISINRNPLTKEQFSNIEFVFEDNTLIKLDYYLYYLNSTQLKNDKEFIDFYNNEIRKEKNTLDEISILDIQNKFYNKKFNKNKDKNDDIEWKYSTTNKDGIQCRVDDVNKVNVFKQKTFNFIDKEYDEALEVINNCTELFYNNSYPIVGIESNNGGGIVEVSLYFQQFLQVKIKQKTFFSTKVSELIKGVIEKDMNDYISIDTCDKFSSFEEMKEITDDYGEGIIHHRTKLFELFNTSVLKEQKKRRQDYFEKYQLKRPTEIIIFTDSFSYSSTSFFIKGLQETGAAILVGYKGNPKSNETFDASQSPSAVHTFNGTDVYNNLKDSGFEIIGTTFFESFNYSCFDKNPTPREYLIHPVDERVNIYQNYDDSLYDKFISEAKRIFKKYNDDQYCNPDNLKLLYDPNNKNECYAFENDSYAHGGYECDPQTKKWSKKCKPYYCDIGYYFDTYQNICVKDKCSELEDKKDNNNTILLVIIVIGSILGLIIIILIIYFIHSSCCKKEKETKVGPLLESESNISLRDVEDN